MVTLRDIGGASFSEKSVSEISDDAVPISYVSTLMSDDGYLYWRAELTELGLVDQWVILPVDDESKAA